MSIHSSYLPVVAPHRFLFSPRHNLENGQVNILAGGNVAFIASYLPVRQRQSELDLVWQNASGQVTAWIERAAVNSSIL